MKKSIAALAAGLVLADVEIVDAQRIAALAEIARQLEAEQLRLRKETQAKKLVLPKDNRFDVVIRFEDGTTYQRSGRLAFTDVRVNNTTGTSDARAEIPNPAGEVRPGQFVRVVLKGAQRPNAITVHTEWPEHTSTRNVWPGRVAAMEVLADRDRIARELHEHVIARLFGKDG